KLVTGQRPEQLLLQQRCSRARAPIVVNGTTINLASEHEEYTVAALLEHPDIELPTAPRTRLSRAAAGPLAGWLGIKQHQPEEHIWVVVHGVSFPLDRALDIPGVGGTIFCDALKKDLSQQRLLRDQTFWNLHFELAELARHLWTLLPWPPNASRALPSQAEAGEQAPLRSDEQLSGRAIVRRREGHRKLVLLPSPCHTGRVFYGPGEEFLDTELGRLGVGTLTVSHPICNPLFWGVYPDFDLEDWAGVVANQVLQAGWEETPVAGWNVPFALVEFLQRAFRERGLRMTGFHLLLAPPWPPEQFELTRQGVVDTDSLAPWPGPDPELVVGYPSKYLVIDAPLKLSPWDFPFQVSYAQTEAERPLCRAMARLALAQKELLASAPVPLVNIPEGDFPFYGDGAAIVAQALCP
ncbi:MAG: hypothetical protein KC910_33085, partial [Candidatus Eremiobacteraeota bacterium]|nr:hypothetical protein [Candidatus Eremiobacteraeota bacterium]